MENYIRESDFKIKWGYKSIETLYLWKKTEKNWPAKNEWKRHATCWIIIENSPPKQTAPTGSTNGSGTQIGGGEEAVFAYGGTRRPIRINNCRVNIIGTTGKDFKGDTPKIGEVLGLHSENATKKINYDLFYEKMGTCIMTEFKNGDAVFPVTNNYLLISNISGGLKMRHDNALIEFGLISAIAFIIIRYY